MQADSYPPTSRLCSSGSRRKSFALKALPAAAALLFSPAGWTIDIVGGAGLPQNGTVFSGAASGSVAGNQLTINQSTARAVVDWASFNIDAGKAVQILQPSAAAAMLNRVTGDANPSQILGSLSANGTVMLMNPNGVMFGQNATVNVGSLIATTGNIDVNNFINTGGALITGTAGSITNQGSITAQGAGLVALVAPSVTNQGSITATGGTIALAGSTAATVSLNGGLYEFAIPAGATGTSVSNTAGASLDGAMLLLGVGDAANLLSGVINLEGVQQASNAIVVNGHAVVLKSALQAPNVSGNANRVDVYSGARIQDGVNIAKTGSAGAGAVVDVHAGDYAEQVALNKANLTLTGLAGARIVVPDAAQANGISITANNVTVTGLEIAGPVSQPYLSYGWGSNISRGIVVANGATGFTISNNNIHDVRNGILIDGRNTGSVTGNRIENTKSAISVQYTDADGITIAGNSQGPVGNEWGLNLHLNGYVHGANIDSNPIGAAPTIAWQQSLLALSAGNGGWSVQDQGYTSSNRTHVAVATTGSGSAQGSLLAPLDTLQAGVDAVVTGGTVNVAGGTYVQPVTLRVNKGLTLAGAGQGATVIDARGVSGYGINVTADNVSLKDFTLYGPSADVASSYGIKVAPTGGASARLHNFSISNVTSRGAGRAELDLNGVDGALIDHVTADGAPVGNNSGSTQGAGIQLTDSANVTITNSATRNNAWGGLALYQSNRYYNQQMNNITVAGNNSFTERNPVYLQDESHSRDFGALNIAGFDFAVRNASTAGDNNQYTWLQASQQNAFDYAVNLGSSASSYIQGWNGAQLTQDFHVGVGNLLGGGTQAMSVGNTLGNAGSGANIRVAGGTFAEDVVVNNPYNLYFSGSTLRSLTLTSGAGGSGIGGTVTADGAGGFKFGGAVNLLGDTTLTTQGADIAFTADIQNAGGVARALRLIAGSGGARGNVFVKTGGKEIDALGQFDVSANAFTLEHTLWVKGYKIDALGDVSLSNSTLKAVDTAAASTLTAGGDVTGSTTNAGKVEVISGGDIIGKITGTDVVAKSEGVMNVVVVASNSAVFEAKGETMISGSAPQITIDAPSGSLSGSFGQVSNTGGGLINVNGKPQGNQTLSSNAENNRVIPSGNSLVDGVKGEEPVLQLAQASMLTGEGEPVTVRSSPSNAGEAIDNGQAVELDMSPKNEREKNKD